MKLHSVFITVMVAICFSGCSGTRANVTTFAPPEYLAWLDELKQDMLKKGISQHTIDEVYSHDFYSPESEVVKIDRKQLEFSLTSTDYLNRVVNAKRVNLGRQHYKELRSVLKPISDKYKVPPHYLIAFWGVETNFGTNFGGFNTIAALTALSYDRRRPQFFKNELYQALKIIDTWKIDYTKMQGSWAGAMGHFQFMPSTFNAYAVDFNQDGQIDIWHSFEDAAASAANYLSEAGWDGKLPWGIEVSLPWNFDFAQTGRRNKKTIAQWQKQGIKTIKHKKLDFVSSTEAAIITPEGKKGRAYLVFNNFDVIMKWNRSENYALAVGHLADYIENQQKWVLAKEDSAVRLKTDDIIKVQSFINKLGWFKLEEDGQLGTQTREAVKKIQKEAKLPQDGYPDYQLINRINNYNPEIGFAIPVPSRKLHNKN